MSIMASSKLLCLSFFLVVVAAASPMLLKFHDFSNSVWGEISSKMQTVNPWLLALGSLFLGYVLWKLWRILFLPLEMKRQLHETGYLSDGKRPLKEIANEIRKRRQCGDIPPVYPNGWFHVLASRELAVGEVKYVSMLGEQLAVFRGTDGKAHIVNAYCPHLGANLGIGGKVVGNCLQCPFHGWTFRGEDGKCVKIPYSDKVPDFAKTKAWPCLEVNCTIYMWYHAEGTEPTWTPDVIDEIKNGSWTYRGCTQHCINAHIEEVPENGSDITHLNHLHTSLFITGADLRYNFLDWCQVVAHHSWSAQWEPLEDEKHVGQLQLTHSFVLFGYKIPSLDFHVTARQVGPGLVFMKFKSILGDGIFLHSLTPKEPLLQTMCHHIYASWTIPTFLAKFFLYVETIQVERDIMIWNHKTYLSSPLLVKEDQSIKKHRRWYSQFFSENSPRLSMKKETLDW